MCISSSSGTFSGGSAVRAGYLGTQRLVLVMSPGFFLATVVLNDRFLLKSWILETEEMYEIGQWGLLAGLVLVSAAAVVNWVVGRMVRGLRDEMKDGGDGVARGTEIIV